MNKLNLVTRCGLVLAAASVLWSCETGRHGRILGRDEPDLVGNTKAGAATFDRLIEGSVTKLFNRYKTDVGSVRNVAFLRFDNRSAEELGSWNEQIYELIDTKINKFESTQTISEKFITAGMKEAGIGRYEQLFVPSKRRAFMKIMEQQNNPVDAIVSATFTSGDTDGTGRYRQSNYTMTLEMIDTESGRNLKESSRIRVERR